MLSPVVAFLVHGAFQSKICCSPYLEDEEVSAKRESELIKVMQQIGGRARTETGGPTSQSRALVTGALLFGHLRQGWHIVGVRSPKSRVGNLWQE